MSDWNSGYITEINYTHGYYTELNPLRVNLAFLNAGLTPPQQTTACELGFGQGLSINMHASASNVKWFGTDFNPSQAGFARDVAAASGSDVRLYDNAFDEFASREDLPNFDYIGLHGIWTWISNENRAVIVDFIRRKLNVGGVVYISYNTMPGWAAFAPMRHLFNEHVSTMSPKGAGTADSITAALAFADTVQATNPNYTKANPQVGERLKKLTDQNRNYLAHEYFNKDWHPTYFSEMVEALSAAKLTYACSTHLLDHLDAINLSADQQKLLNELPDTNFRQTIRDFMVNQQFRKDYWVKGAKRLSPVEQANGLKSLRLVLQKPRNDLSLKVTGSLGEADMSEAVYGPILDVLADHAPHTIDDILHSVAEKGVNLSQVVQAAIVLTGAGHTALARDDETTDRSATDRLNAHLVERAQHNTDISFLASPVTGGGVTVGRFQQLFLMAIGQGRNTPEDWARHVWSILSGQGQKLVKDGKTLETAEENIAELTTQASNFANEYLPVLKGLKVA